MLVYAAVSGKLDAVKQIIPPDLRDCDTPVKRVAVCGLLRRCDVFGRSVFHYLAHHGLTEIFFYLLDAFETVRGWPEFALGAMPKLDVDVMPLSDLSIPKKATQESVFRHESRDLAPTVLCQAALQGHLELVMKLLAKGATDISYREEPSSAVSDADLVAVAEQAAQQCTAEDSDSGVVADVDLTKLPKQGVSPPPPEADAVRDTALICAASGGHTLVLQALLTSGKCDIEARGQFGETAIHRAAACKGGRDAMKLLIEAGANVDSIAEPPEGWSDDERGNLTLYWGGTALLRVAHVGDVERVNMLLAKNVKVRSNCGNACRFEQALVPLLPCSGMRVPGGESCQLLCAGIQFASVCLMCRVCPVCNPPWSTCRLMWQTVTSTPPYMRLRAP